ncbi:hypothetical protein TEQG_08818 [Trichophyton equinum CBS 127.97]|uniref:Rhodopsin domain-containing protein n=1 Tax=Trichophyton equinum (strain ATCC MYA-4606 / CBS 127.97) TaxID=559882 RepID=F2Q3Q7_TRIEC|nr:hypothetical protein TEQG_08818 [Trichophyton equinum CBS 127.97]
MATQWLGAIPPPPGVTPNIIDPPSQLSGNIALHTVCLTLATAAVAMRVYTRTVVTRTNMGADDCADSRIFRVDDKIIYSGHWAAFMGHSTILGSICFEMVHLCAIRLLNPDRNDQAHIPVLLPPAVAASLVRLAETPVLKSSPDATWNISRLAVWAVIEANVGIFCGCLLLLPAFLDRHLPKSIASSIKVLFSSSNSRKLEKGGSSDASSKQYSWPNSTHSHKVSVSASSKRHSYLELNPSNSVHDAV